jgi:thiol-disulfide isomerase/thioredoxin
MAGLDGDFRSIRDFEGRPVVVNLWASWCPPCRREMPLLAQTAAAQPDVAFLFVNQGESSETIRRYLARDRLELGHVLLDPAMAVSRHYAAQGLPVTLFLRPDGTLASLHTGEISREALAAGIDGIRRETR